MLPKLWESNKYQLETTDNGIILASIAFSYKVYLEFYKLGFFLEHNLLAVLSVYFCLKYEYIALERLLLAKERNLEKLKGYY